MAELKELRFIWGENFAKKFSFLLKTSIEHKKISSSMDISGKKGLFQLIDMADNYSVDYNNILLFNPDIHKDSAFSSVHIAFFNELYHYSGDDKETNNIYTWYYINIIKNLFKGFNLSDSKKTAFMLMDICKSNTHSRREVAEVMGKSTPVLINKENLENIRQISVTREYSPDIFISLNAIKINLDYSTITSTREFLQDKNYRRDIKQEIFEYGLVMTNELFDMRSLYSSSTLKRIYEFLMAIQKENRNATVDFINKVEFLKENIETPEDMLEFIPVMKNLEKIETDMYDKNLLNIMPSFDNLVTSKESLLLLFSELS